MKNIFKLECLLIFFIYVMTLRICAFDIYSKFYQTDYKLEFQRVELVSYEKSVWNWFNMRTSKFNRTFPVVHFSFNAKKNLTRIEIIVQIYKFLSNEYRHFPVRFQVNFCKSMKSNLAGLNNMKKCGNFTDCNIYENIVYRICNFYTDEKRFPPNIPNGQFKARSEFVNDNEDIFTLDYYFQVYRPIAVKNKN